MCIVFSKTGFRHSTSRHTFLAVEILPHVDSHTLSTSGQNDGSCLLFRHWKHGEPGQRLRTPREKVVAAVEEIRRQRKGIGRGFGKSAGELIRARGKIICRASKQKHQDKNAALRGRSMCKRVAAERGISQGSLLL